MNRYLTYQKGQLLFEDVALAEIAEEMYTPFYVYSKAAILEKVESLRQAFSEIKPMMAFHMKALDTCFILKLLKERGCGLAVENFNEMSRAHSCGYDSTSLVLNSFGLPDHELSNIIKHRPLVINVAHLFELEPLNRLATQASTGVRIGIRVDLNIDTGGTSPIAKKRSGLTESELREALDLVKKLPQLNLVCLATHIGSQVTHLAPWIKLAEKMASLSQEVRKEGFNIEYLDLGGGFPVEYGYGEHIEIKKIARNMIPYLKDLDCRVILEPGSYFTAEAGLLVTSVVGVKEVNGQVMVICDAGFSELPTAALSHFKFEVAPLIKGEKTQEGGEEAQQKSEGIITSSSTASTYPAQSAQSTQEQPASASSPASTDKLRKAHLIGPGNEEFNFLVKDIEIAVPKRGDLIAILNVGAYGRTMAGNYGSRSRPPEVLIEKDKFEVIRSRETVEDLLACDLIEGQV